MAEHPGRQLGLVVAVVALERLEQQIAEAAQFFKTVLPEEQERPRQLLDRLSQEQGAVDQVPMLEQPIAQLGVQADQAVVGLVQMFLQAQVQTEQAAQATQVAAAEVHLLLILQLLELEATAALA
jgi:hypothetical protein